LKFSVFIISWSGKHDNAEHMARALSAFRDQLTIVYSDPDPNLSLNVDCRTIRRPNDKFFSDKFKACLDAATGDLFLLLHADCTCDDWAALVRRCIDWHRANPAIGIWAPFIAGSQWAFARTRILHLSGTTLSLVAQPDSICFSLTRPIIERLRRVDYSTNTFGWGIDWLMTCAALSRNLYVVVDEGVTVKHPQSTGYDREQANKGLQEFQSQFTIIELMLARVLSAYVTRPM
jgi:hypothetical protein